MSTVTIREFLAVFLRAGNLTFGGGDPTMAALHNDLTGKRGWIGEEHYGLCYALARVTPGTNILAFCAATGWSLLGWLGALLGVAAVTIPSAFVLLWLTQAYGAAKENPWVAAAVGGVIAATVGMMGSAAYGLVKPHWRAGQYAFALAIVACSAAFAYGFRVPPITILAVAAVVGYFRKP